MFLRFNAYWTVSDPQSEIQIPCNLMIALVAGVDLNRRPLGYERTGIGITGGYLKAL